MLKLETVLNIKKEQFDDYKIHFAIGNQSNNRLEPLYAFQGGIFKEWQESQNQKNFERKYIISLIYYKVGKWIFAGIYESRSYEKRNNKYFYTTELTDIQNDLIGRIIIGYDKTYRQSYVLGEKYISELIVSEILEKPAMIEEFPGYSKINIDYKRLKLVIDQEVTTWKNALSIMKGIYIIVDKNTGKQYVGSATGEWALWSRWSEYIKTGHGGNKKLKKLIEENGIEYASNFCFSILEVSGINTADDTILQRESFWKQILMTREFGYNDN